MPAAAAAPEIVKPVDLIPPPAVSSMLDACTGSSVNLAAVECAAWVALYDVTGGATGGATQWAWCGANRLDPCGCSYLAANKVTRGVTCSADGHNILLL